MALYLGIPSLSQQCATSFTQKVLLSHTALSDGHYDVHRPKLLSMARIVEITGGQRSSQVSEAYNESKACF